MRDVEVKILDGITRRQLGITLSELSSKYRGASGTRKSVNRSRICQVERVSAPSRDIRRAYCLALRAVLAARRRRAKRTGF